MQSDLTGVEMCPWDSNNSLFDGLEKKGTSMKYKVKCYESTEYTFEVEAEDEDSAWEVAHDILLGKDGCEGAIRLESPDETPIACDVTEREWDITEE